MQLSGVHLSVCLPPPYAARRVYATVWCPSVCLSAPSVRRTQGVQLSGVHLSVCRTPHATAAGLLLCTWWAGDGSVAAAAARECGQ